MNDVRKSQLRALPATSRLIATDAFVRIAGEFGPGLAKFELRALVDAYRSAIRDGQLDEAPAVEALFGELRDRLVRLSRPEGRRAINATGILLHTGLGRAPLCRAALEAIGHFGHYSLLQADLEDGGRGLREQKVERMLRELTGCEAACVVNNNAAATMLILNTLAAKKEVIISRGELVEIGGSFRIPDVMAESGAILREVGTTNRTHLGDYERAISEETAAILHVHPSNYRIRGFVSAPSIEELVELAHRHSVLAIHDLGSGALVPLSPFGLPDEPLVKDSIAAGMDVCCFSGDKLISGPQAGIILAKQTLIQRIRKNPIARMLRVCKLTLAALEATLCHYLDGDSYREAIPLYRMLARTVDELEQRGEELARRIGAIPLTTVRVVEQSSYIGSGTVPDQGVPSRAVSLKHEDRSARDIARRLRQGIPAVFGHISGDCVLFDLRTVEPSEVPQLARSVKRALS
jgi:L-seryl-tRNA(Ser) seleniumtransferase